MKKGKYITCKLCNHKFKLNSTQKEQWAEDRFLCPNCKEIYCILPKTERLLRELQDKFLEGNRDERFITEIYKILIPYSESIFKKEFSELNNPEDIRYYTENSVSLLIEEYYSKPDFKVNTSFGGLLYYKLIQAYSGKMEIDKKEYNNISLDYQFKDDNFIEYQDQKNDFVSKIIENESKELLCKYILELIFGVKDYCNTRQNYIYLTVLNLYLTFGERSVDNFFRIYKKEGKLVFLRALKMIKSELNKLHLTSL